MNKIAHNIIDTCTKIVHYDDISNSLCFSGMQLTYFAFNIYKLVLTSYIAQYCSICTNPKIKKYISFNRIF